MSDEFITKHEYKTALGEPVYAFTVHCRSEASRKAGIQAQKNRPIEAAYVPFDPPEEPAWPSDATAREYPPNCDGNNTAGDVLAQAQYEAAVDGDDCTSGVCLAVRGAND